MKRLPFSYSRQRSEGKLRILDERSRQVQNGRFSSVCSALPRMRTERARFSASSSIRSPDSYNHERFPTLRPLIRRTYMTVIATVITDRFTAHATDSYLTVPRGDGRVQVREDERTKLVPVPAWRGAMAYFGLACAGGWDTLAWLRDQSDKAGEFESAETFAHSVAIGLDTELSKLPVSRQQLGIGVHFSAYEEVDGEWIPELFFISNFAGIPYSIRPEGVRATRETYGAAKGVPDRPSIHGDQHHRGEVLSFLRDSKSLYFNNGDPELFNPVANSIFDVFRQLSMRGQVHDFSPQKHLSLVRRPIELVAILIQDFAEPGYAVIGGKLHDLAIGSDGSVFSSTGDNLPAPRLSCDYGQHARPDLDLADLGLAYSLGTPPQVLENIGQPNP